MVVGLHQNLVNFSQFQSLLNNFVNFSQFWSIRVFRYAGDHYGANRNSGREISNSGPEMCIPLLLRPKSRPAGREKPIRVAAIRVVTKYIGWDHYGANRNSGREISNSGPEMYTPLLLRPEMCTPLFLRLKSKPAGREKPIRVAPIRVVTKYPINFSQF